MASKWYRLTIEDESSMTAVAYKTLEEMVVCICKKFIKTGGAEKLEQVVHSVVIAEKGTGYDFRSGIPPVT